jgi:hypothetical protein
MGFGARAWYRQAAEVAGLMVAAWVAVGVVRRWVKGVSEIWSEMLTRGAIRITEYAYFKISLCVLMDFKLPY